VGLRDLRKRLDNDPEFRAEYEGEYPFEAVAMAIQGLRADLGWTQRDLATEAGVPQSSVARAESGRHSFEIALLNRIGDAADMAWRPLFFHRVVSASIADLTSLRADVAPTLPMPPLTIEALAVGEPLELMTSPAREALGG